MKAEVKAQAEEIGKKNNEVKSLVDKKERLIKHMCDYDVTKTSKNIEKTKLEDEIKDTNAKVFLAYHFIYRNYLLNSVLSDSVLTTNAMRSRFDKSFLCLCNMFL